jgi:hypothetical protein
VCLTGSFYLFVFQNQEFNANQYLVLTNGGTIMNQEVVLSSTSTGNIITIKLDQATLKSASNGIVEVTIPINLKLSIAVDGSSSAEVPPAPEKVKKTYQHTPEAKERIREAARKRWADKRASSPVVVEPPRTYAVSDEVRRKIADSVRATWARKRSGLPSAPATEPAVASEADRQEASASA